MVDCPGLDPKAVQQYNERARKLNIDLDINKSDSDTNRFFEAKQATLAFIDEALKLPLPDQQCVFKAAQAVNDDQRRLDDKLPNINIVMSREKGTLARFQLSYPHRWDTVVTTEESRETIDLYAP